MKNNITKSLIYDDIVEDKEYGDWTNVCNSHIKEASKDGQSEDIDIDDIICGVQGCQRIAQYYLTFNRKTPV